MELYHIKSQKVVNLISKLIDNIELNWSKMLNNSTKLRVSDMQNKSYKEVAGNIKEGNVFIEIEMELDSDSADNFYIILSKSDCLNMIGLILKKEPEAIDKIDLQPDTEGEIMDEFIKFCKSTTESLQTAFNDNMQTKSKLSFKRCLMPPNDDAELRNIFSETNNDIMFHADSEFTLPGPAGDINSNLSIFFPLELTEDFFGETIYFINNESKGTILVVDDSKPDISIIRKYLRDNDFRILGAKNEKTTLEKLFSEKIDLVLLDLFLGQENGLSICRRIRRNIMCSNMPVIMYSCGSTKENIFKSLRVGAQDFLAKPFEQKQLINKIKKYVAELK